LVQQCFQLGIHPQSWKTAQGILLKKPGKKPEEYSLVRAYRVISLLNSLGKVVEKIAAEAIAKHCKAVGALHRGQMGCRRRRSAVDAVACLVQEVHEAWAQLELAGVLLMNVKEAFDHIVLSRLTD
jgi:hypothetical protein